MDDIEGRIIENRRITADHCLMKVRLAMPMGRVEPGQFVMVRLPDRDLFLRRPFSIFDSSGNTLSIMYRVVGKGTASLGMGTVGKGVKVLGPLGKGFHITRRDAYLVIAGGIGLAGVRTLLKRLGKRASLFFGCATREEVVLAEDVTAFNPAIATLDGSCGFKGNVVALLGEHLKAMEGRDVEVFACGPDGMLRSLKTLLEKGHIPCQVLLEERMACGLGLCFGCVTKTMDDKEPYKRVCKEGPAFSLWEISL